MSQILLVTTNFWPEPTGTAIYTTDLAMTLLGHGHEITVLTSLPHYPWWRIPKEYSYLSEGESLYEAVRVVRAKHIVPSKMNAFSRVRFELSLWSNLLRVSRRFHNGDFNLVIATIPTVAAGIVAKSISKRLKIPLGIVVEDLSGAGAKQSGLPGGAIIAKVAEFVETFTLKSADELVIVSPAMSNVIETLGVKKSKITQIYNYSARIITQVDKEESRKIFGWSPQDFVVIHTGNMGAKQDLENVVRAAGHLVTDNKIKIFLVGHGNQEENLKTMCFEQRNISVLPAVADENYSALLAAADLLLVNERSTQLEMSLPSKLTSYLYSQRPVIAAVPRGGATWKFLEGTAELVDAENPQLLAERIVQLQANPLEMERLADAGFKFAQNHLSPESGRAHYLKWVDRILNTN